MTKTIDITVCTFTYNRYVELEKLIKSFIQQSYEASELLIIDDLGSSKTKQVVQSWQKKDKRIRYHRNTKTVGFSNNLKQSYKLSKGKYVVFMGDDDVFLDTKTLEYFIKAFQDKSIGVVKAAQLVFKGNTINQAYAIPPHKTPITIHDKGLESYRKLWFESLSITGLAFRIVPEIFTAVNNTSTLYPQVEHMGVISLTYKSASINKYLVGVQSHEGQLNCISYDLDGVQTNLIDDWLALHERINQIAQKTNQPFISLPEFKTKLAAFFSLFLPYNRLTNGFLNTANMVVRNIQLHPLIICNPTFLIATTVSLILPKPLIRSIIEMVKHYRLTKLLSDNEISKYNKIVQQYY